MGSKQNSRITSVHTCIYFFYKEGELIWILCVPVKDCDYENPNESASSSSGFLEQPMKSNPRSQCRIFAFVGFCAYAEHVRMTGTNSVVLRLYIWFHSSPNKKNGKGSSVSQKESQRVCIIRGRAHTHDLQLIFEFCPVSCSCGHGKTWRRTKITVKTSVLLLRGTELFIYIYVSIARAFHTAYCFVLLAFT